MPEIPQTAEATADQKIPFITLLLDVAFIINILQVNNYIRKILTWQYGIVKKDYKV